MVVFQLFEGVSSDRSHLVRQSYSGQERNRVAYFRIEDEKDETERKICFILRNEFDSCRVTTMRVVSMAPDNILRSPDSPKDQVFVQTINT